VGVKTALPPVREEVELEDRALAAQLPQWSTETPAGSLSPGRFAVAALLWSVPGLVVIHNLVVVHLAGLSPSYELPREAILTVGLYCAAVAAFGGPRSLPAPEKLGPRVGAFALGAGLFAALAWTAVANIVPGGWAGPLARMALAAGQGAWVGVVLAGFEGRWSGGFARGLGFGALLWLLSVGPTLWGGVWR
jgi:hypothetical protein